MSVRARLPALRRERPRFTAVALAFVAFLAVWPFVDWWLRSQGIAGPFGFFDFGAYAHAVDTWLEGEPIYVTNDNGTYHTQYLYPPIALLVFWPFTELPHSRLLWNVFSVAFLWVALQAVVAALGVGLSRLERVVLLWLLLGFQPLILSLKLAQTTAFMTGLLCLALAGLLRGESGSRAARYASGAATAAVGAIKPSFSTVGAHLLADRDRLVGALATGGGLLAVSLVVFGIDTHIAYLDVLQWGLHHGDEARSPALWLAPYFKPLAWLPDTPFGLSGSLLLRLTASALIAIGAILAAPDADREVFALGVVAFPLLSPLTYTYYFLAAVPGVLVLLAVEFERDGHPIVPVVGLWILAIHAFGLKLITERLPALMSLGDALRPYLPIVEPRTLYPVLQPGTWGLLLLIGLAGYRVAQTVRPPAFLSGE